MASLELFVSCLAASRCCEPVWNGAPSCFSAGPCVDSNCRLRPSGSALIATMTRQCVILEAWRAVP